MHERTTDQEDALPKESYLGPSYFAWTQLVSLVQQIIDVHATGARKILEIGKGTAFVSEFLKKAEMDVTTFDINASLEPDVVGSVLELEKFFEPDSFDCVLCAQVLEHLPFENFRTAVEQIAKVCRGSCILTLPRLQRVLIDWQMRLKLPRVRYKTVGLFLAWRPSKKQIYAGHHWEINSRAETKLPALRSVLRGFFEIERDYRLRWNPYHHFFNLRKKGRAGGGNSMVEL